MDADLQWRYVQIDGRWAVVAEKLPNYRAQIMAVVPKRSHQCRSWAVYENQRVIAQGIVDNTAAAKRMCALYLRIAQHHPPLDPLPSLAQRSVVSHQ
jgi:hypothetical protein